MALLSIQDICVSCVPYLLVLGAWTPLLSSSVQRRIITNRQQAFIGSFAGFKLLSETCRVSHTSTAPAEEQVLHGADGIDWLCSGTHKRLSIIACRISVLCGTDPNLSDRCALVTIIQWRFRPAIVDPVVFVSQGQLIGTTDHTHSLIILRRQIYVDKVPDLSARRVEKMTGGALAGQWSQVIEVENWDNQRW